MAPVVTVDGLAAAEPARGEGVCSTSQPSSPAKAPPPAVAAEELSVAQPQAAKKKSKDPSTEFVGILSSRIDEIEKNFLSGSNNAERECGKARKKALREVIKYVSDRANPTEERIDFLQNKYATQVAELVKAERQVLDLQKEVESLGKEKDKVQQELRKSNLLRDKLEDLCRQLQKEAKEANDASQRRTEEDLRQRMALQAKFSAAINDVTAKMDQQQAERNRQAEENEALRVKLNTFLEQFESFNTLLEKKDLELQLAAARLEQQAEMNKQLSSRCDLLQQANEQYLKAHESFKEDLEGALTAQAQVKALTAVNAELKQQVEHYYDKFAEFQSTLTKSNEMFEKMRGEMEAANKARTALVAERDEARVKAAKSAVAIVQLLEDRMALKKQLEAVQRALGLPGAGGAGGESGSGKASGGGSGSGGSAVVLSAARDEDVKRLRTQKEALEGLCRTLQAKVKAYESGASKEEATAAATSAAKPTSSDEKQMELPESLD